MWCAVLPIISLSHEHIYTFHNVANNYTLLPKRYNSTQCCRYKQSNTKSTTSTNTFCCYLTDQLKHFPFQSLTSVPLNIVLLLLVFVLQFPRCCCCCCCSPQLPSFRQLSSSLRKSATASGSSHRSWVVSCVGHAGHWNKCSTECDATPQFGQTSVTPAVMRAFKSWGAGSGPNVTEQE